MPEIDQGTNVCYVCVGDEFLNREIQLEGQNEHCSFCGCLRKTVSLEEMSDQIHEILQEHFYLTSSEPEGLDYLLAKEGLWERPGEPVENVIADIAQLNEEIAKAIRECLSDQHGYCAVRDGEEDPYADDALYEENRIDDWEFQETWNAFREEITSRSRFFSQHAQEALDEIFGEIDTLSSFGGTPVIRDISPTDDERYIFRARVSFSDKELEEILSAPVKQIGPPPSRRAKAGRMNAAGISVFYGAIDKETCIAEARAPVGSYVVLGRFEVIRPVRLLDFDTLTKVYVEGSHFDPNYHTGRSRAAFLRRLVHEISRPVMPRDEEFEYLPTQVVSEYLAARVEPRLDGIVFHSSQTAGEGRNLVLFNHACGVEPYELPKGTEIDIHMGWVSEDDCDDSITIFETVLDKPSEQKQQDEPPEPFGFSNIGSIDIPEDDPDSNAMHDDSTLRLDLDSVSVQEIKSVSYTTSIRSVSRHRSTKGEDQPF